MIDSGTDDEHSFGQHRWGEEQNQMLLKNPVMPYGCPCAESDFLVVNFILLSLEWEHVSIKTGSIENFYKL